MNATALPLPCIALITDRHVCGGANALVERVEEAVEGGVTLVQLREKDLRTGELQLLAVRLWEVTAGRALLLVNDRVDVAVACGADGVQLPEASLSAADARRVIGDRPMLVGRSVHDASGAVAAATDGADFVLAGAVFETASHPGQAPSGLRLIEEVRRSVAVPVIAVGGITADNAASVVAAGADGVAVIREVLAASNVRAAAARLREAVERAYLSPGLSPRTERGAKPARPSYPVQRG